MNIITYDKDVDLYQLMDIRDMLLEKFPEQKFLFVPKGVEFMAEVSAECLFSIADDIVVALEKIKEERPEEYQQAYQNRMIILRDKQWKEALNKANKKHKKKKCVCDECTVINCPDYDENRKEKCEWFSKNPGGI